LDRSLVLSGLEYIFEGFVKVVIVSIVLLFFGWLVTQCLEYTGVSVVLVVFVVWIFYCRYFGVDSCGDSSEYALRFNGGLC
jgi:hypothetical protein